MQVQANWNCAITPEDFKSQFKHDFRGPGFYLTDTDTLLVVPVSYGEDAIWHLEQKRNLYEAYVYNVPFSQTIFAAIATAPIRLDTRK